MSQLRTTIRLAPDSAGGGGGLFALPSVEAPSSPGPVGNTSNTSLPGESKGPAVPDSIPEGVEEAFETLGQGGTDHIELKFPKEGEAKAE